jgi:hypothetical protein
VLINPIIRNRTRHFRRAYHPTRDSIIFQHPVPLVNDLITLSFIYIYASTVLLLISTAFQFLDLLHSRQDSLDGGSAHRKAVPCIHRTAQTQNKRTQTSMPQVEFEPTIALFERTKTFHALDGAATVIRIIIYKKSRKGKRSIIHTPYILHCFPQFTILTTTLGDPKKNRKLFVMKYRKFIIKLTVCRS